VGSRTRPAAMPLGLGINIHVIGPLTVGISRCCSGLGGKTRHARGTTSLAREPPAQAISRCCSGLEDKTHHARGDRRRAPEPPKSDILKC
jgi:hypothetical protein